MYGRLLITRLDMNVHSLLCIAARSRKKNLSISFNFFFFLSLFVFLSLYSFLSTPFFLFRLVFLCVLLSLFLFTCVVQCYSFEMFRNSNIPAMLLQIFRHPCCLLAWSDYFFAGIAILGRFGVNQIVRDLRNFLSLVGVNKKERKSSKSRTIWLSQKTT